MGVAGVAMLWMLVSIVKSLVAVVQLFIWKSKISGVAHIKELIKKDAKFDDKGRVSSTEYQYSVNIESEMGVFTSVMTETLPGEAYSKLQVGDTTRVYYDKEKNAVKGANDLTNDLKIWLISFAISTAILVACFVIVALIG